MRVIHVGHACHLVEIDGLRILSDPRDDAALREVRAYLACEGGDDRRYDLAWRIADVYDRYLVYRPDWIEAWEAGGEDHWQARLWRVLAADTRSTHRVRLQRAFVTALDHAAAAPYADRTAAPYAVDAADAPAPGAAGLPRRNPAQPWRRSRSAAS